MTNIFTELQEEIARRLRSDDWIKIEPAVEVLVEAAGDTFNQVQRTLSAHGMVVVVSMPEIGPVEDAGDSLVASVKIGIGERTGINRGPTGTRRLAFDGVVKCLALLRDQRPLEAWSELEFVRATHDEASADFDLFTVEFRTVITVSTIDDGAVSEA